jgi:hypothetical protein
MILKTVQIGLLILLALLSHAATADDADPVVPEDGLLVLANGSIMEGTIARDGDYYRVLLEKGTLRVRADQVDFFCQTMAEAYQRRQARRLGQMPSADAHVEMAQWCLQHELIEFAFAELAAARELDPQHTLLPMIERRLAQAKEMATAKALTPAPVPIVDEQVHEANSEMSFGEIPLWARSEFIKRVQPMMAHSCAKSGCHLPNSPQEMKIDRSALDGVGNPELIHRNLSVIIAEVNLEEPEKSRLLTMGAAAHGNTKDGQSRPLTPHQLEILRAWVTQLSVGEAPIKEEREAQSRNNQIVVGVNSSAQQAYLKDGQAAAASTDPFDPSEFNRQNTPEAKADESSSEPQAVEAQPTETLPVETPPADPASH